MTISPSQSNRLTNLGFIAALLVVSIHLGKLPHDVGSWQWFLVHVVKNIFAVTSVPFFFIVSGYFLARRVGEPQWWKHAVLQRVRTLGIPYFVWCLVPFLLFTFIWPVDNPGGECSRTVLKTSSILAAFGINLLTVPEASRPMWYVRTLFIFFLISPIVAMLVRRWRLWAIFLFWALYWLINPGLCDVGNFYVSVRWQVVTRFTFSMEGLFYFAVGMYLYNHPIHLEKMRGIALGLVGLALGAVALVLQGRGICDFGYVRSASIPFTLCLLWTLVSDSRWPAVLVGNSFALYVIHPVVLTALSQLPWLSEGALGSLLEWTLAVVLSIAITTLFRRLSPKLASLFFGGR